MQMFAVVGVVGLVCRKLRKSQARAPRQSPPNHKGAKVMSFSLIFILKQRTTKLTSKSFTKVPSTQQGGEGTVIFIDFLNKTCKHHKQELQEEASKHKGIEARGDEKGGRRKKERSSTTRRQRRQARGGRKFEHIQLNCRDDKS